MRTLVLVIVLAVFAAESARAACGCMLMRDPGRSAKLDSGQAVPGFVADDVDTAFESMFATPTKKNDTRAVFTEWAGLLPTAGLLPSTRRLRATGDSKEANAAVARCALPATARVGDRYSFVKAGARSIWRSHKPEDQALRDCIEAVPPPPSGAARIEIGVVDEAPAMFATRLHFRYDEERFPEDLVLQVTKDRAPVRTKWFARVPWRGTPACPIATKYLAISETELAKEIEAYAGLSGLGVDVVRERAQATTVGRKP